MRPPSSPSGPAASQPAVDLRALRGATVSGDAERILATLADHDVSLVLQHAREALLVGLRATPERARHPAVEVSRHLRSRHQVGDEELADEIDAVLQGATPPGRAVPVDMDLLIMDMEGIEGAQEGFLNTETGAVCPGEVIESGDMDDSEDDFEDEAWRPIERVGSRLGWQDMSDYVSTVSDPSLASDLARALKGKGAFRRFKEVFDNGLGDAWHAYSDELQLGRARVFLNGLGIRESGR